MFKVGIATRYQMFSVHPETGKETVLTGVFGNKMLTSGLNEMANRDWFTAVQVGTDNTLPAAGQTSLYGYLDGTTTLEENVYGAQGSPPYYGWRRKRFRFNIGSITENQIVKELGIGWSAATGDNIATRALPEDIDGVQTTVTWKADEYLDIVIEVRYYPPLVDVTGTVVLNGVTYNYIGRAAYATSSTAWGFNVGTQIESYAAFSTDWSTYDDNLNTIEFGPNGVPTSGNSLDFTDAYADNTFQITFGMIGGPADWNSSTGRLARSFLVKTTAGWYQIQFDSQASPGNGIPKTDQFTLTLRYVLGWAEQII